MALPTWSFVLIETSREITTRNNDVTKGLMTSDMWGLGRLLATGHPRIYPATHTLHSLSSSHSHLHPPIPLSAFIEDKVPLHVLQNAENCKGVLQPTSRRKQQVQPRYKTAFLSYAKYQTININGNSLHKMRCS